MSDVRIIIGNAVDALKSLPSESVDCIVTSPPYWALRDYGNPPSVWGGDSGCEHQWREYTQSPRGGTSSSAVVYANRNGKANNRGHPTVGAFCTKCGAWKGQLGLEPTPRLYIEHLTEVFGEARRVLKDTGSLWVNLGDTYSLKDTAVLSYADGDCGHLPTGCPKGSLCQIPSRFALAMTDLGWVLRNRIIWHKPNAMPCSQTDRFTVDFEEVFFFAKSQDYYFVPQKEKSVGTDDTDGTRNMRTTWSIPLVASRTGHVATFPPRLAEIPISASCPQGGTVLDPFCGSGTVLEVARKHGADCIGIDINPGFEKMMRERAMAGIPQLDNWIEMGATEH